MTGSNPPCERIECLFCGGRTTAATRAVGRDVHRHVCPVCRGDGATTREQFNRLQQLRDHVEQLAGSMQVGDAAAAAGTARIVFRIAQSLMDQEAKGRIR